ncbi:hypothetical protein ACXJY6_00685 [Vibrio sp. RC27]
MLHILAIIGSGDYCLSSLGIYEVIETGCCSKVIFAVDHVA